MKTYTAMVPKVMSACGQLYVIIDRDASGKPVSVSVPSVKPGGCIAASMYAICSIIRIALEHGVTLEEIAAKLHDISCYKHDGDVQCCYAALAQAIGIGGLE